jgi:hypothetical protein
MCSTMLGLRPNVAVSRSSVRSLPRYRSTSLANTFCVLVLSRGSCKLGSAAENRRSSARPEKGPKEDSWGRSMFQHSTSIYPFACAEESRFPCSTILKHLGQHRDPSMCEILPLSLDTERCWRGRGWTTTTSMATKAFPRQHSGSS